MSKITSVADLKKKKEQVQLNLGLRENSDAADTHVQIRVGMATCGIASGARETMNFLVEETRHQAIDAVITQTGCMGFCYAEPTVEITLPGKEPVVFGHVDKTKAREIIDRFIIKGELADGIIPVNFKTIDEY
ncbi:MAG: (2Fe-2S) ferredoxin domain-containing protein [Prolixibacteraceae bacterium]|jgi:NADP-reducing hydrogenase subunit HndB|nr:(2Fe-2S) ferredoxin domain-containing protein [Prolixibacteraceae bacterium]MDI9563253.1 (2Fe-2S) ferredoxin domain-containing protein [Bacteroidota bacterium]NLS99335.1 (2Fe-2S) ferredoxin domain-containing protein [Bacteroidales bacterium]OQB81095.1 MAG: NADP-reducing hydrogenase subunit HndB [Bacteroidetes bacterium ADurb.Bin123]HNZ68593.1 (2Fe-2S) ferredoxin domain-containing protein [Prolixibacteraceae bacterium]